MVEHEQGQESEGLRRKRERIRELEAQARDVVARFERAETWLEKTQLAGQAAVIEAELHAVAATPADGYAPRVAVRVEVNR